MSDGKTFRIKIVEVGAEPRWLCLGVGRGILTTSDPFAAWCASEATIKATRKRLMSGCGFRAAEVIIEPACEAL